MKKLSVLLLILVMLFAMLPTTSLAAEDEYIYPISSLQKLEGTIANANNTYVIAKGYYGSVIDLSGLDYDTVVITKGASAPNIGYAFLQDMPVVGQVPNYAGDYYAVVWDTNSVATLEIPYDAGYLYIYYSSNNTIFVPSSVVFKNTSSGTTDTPDDSSQPEDSFVDQNYITVATWNIGHFSIGKNTSTKIPDSSFQSSSQSYCDYIYNQLGADLITLNEYSAMFTPSYRAKNVLFSKYTGTQFEGPQYRYSCNAMFSKLPVRNLSARSFACNQSATINHTNLIKASDYYYLQGEITLGGETVVVVTAHLGFDTTRNPDTVCLDQINELIEKLESYDHVLLMGDWNTRSFTYFEQFTNAGYTLGNDSPSNATLAGNSTNRALDNIIVKGLEVSDFRVHPTSLSDHYAVTATIGISYDSTAHEHQYTSTVSEPTCTQQGFTSYACVSCDESYITDYLPALEHVQVITPGKEATCSQPGLTEGISCSRCGETLQLQTEIQTSEHSYSPWVPGADPATETRQCTLCGYAQRRGVGQTEEQAVEIPPTQASQSAAAPTQTRNDRNTQIWLIIGISTAALIAIIVAVWLLINKKKP